MVDVTDVLGERVAGDDLHRRESGAATPDTGLQEGIESKEQGHRPADERDDRDHYPEQLAERDEEPSEAVSLVSTRGVRRRRRRGVARARLVALRVLPAIRGRRRPSFTLRRHPPEKSDAPAATPRAFDFIVADGVVLKQTRFSQVVPDLVELYPLLPVPGYEPVMRWPVPSPTAQI